MPYVTYAVVVKETNRDTISICWMNYNNKMVVHMTRYWRHEMNGLESNSTIFMSRNEIEEEIPYSVVCGECDQSTS